MKTNNWSSKSAHNTIYEKESHVIMGQLKYLNLTNEQYMNVLLEVINYKMSSNIREGSHEHIATGNGG